SASFQVHPVPAASVVDPTWSPTTAHPHDPVWVAVRVIVLDWADPCAPVNVASAPVNTQTFNAFAVNDPVLVLLTVMEPGAVALYAHHVVSELSPATDNWSIFVHVNPPPEMANVLLSSAMQNAISKLPAGGENAAVVTGLAVPVTKAGVLESSAT